MPGLPCPRWSDASKNTCDAGHGSRINDRPPAGGVGLRTIQATFKKHRGYSPQEFLKSTRLDEAHRQLRSGHASRVIDVAFSCGFTKLSRFSADYSERFGELPSTTLWRGAQQ